MLHPLTQKLARRCVKLTVFAALGTALVACGSLTRGANSSLGVSLQVPSGEDPALFWYGVTQKTLTVTPDGADPTTVPWVQGQSPAVELRQGDHLTFAGTDAAGQLVVSGETNVGEEKNITIPLRRVL